MPRIFVNTAKPKRRRLYVDTSRASRPVTRKTVKRMISNRKEHKFHFREETSLSIDNTAVSRALDMIPQGDGEVNRDGNVVRAEYLDIRGLLQSDLTDSFNNVRIIVIKCTKLSAMDIDASDVLEAASAAANNLYSHYGQNKKNFVVLADKWYYLGGQYGGTAVTKDAGRQKPVRIRAKLGFNLTYDTSATNTARNNGIMMFAYSDSTAGSHPTLTYISSLKFSDA